ncbi:MAG: helix-turn-helix domain-containing protein [Thermoleophilaceae bacterium]
MERPAALLRRLRAEQGVSQRELALRAGTSQAAISDIERGRVSPSVDTVERLLLCLGHRLGVTAEPLPMDSPLSSIMEIQRLSPYERLQRLSATSDFILRHRPAAREAAE